MTTSEDVYEKSNAIREGNRNYAEVGYFTARPAVDFENAHKVFNDGFDRGWQAASTEANKRIEALEGEVAQLNRVINVHADLRDRHREMIAKLQASNNDLREAGQALIDRWDCPKWKDVQHTGFFIDALRRAIAATPAESLQAFENEVIEKCAKVCDHVNQQYSDIFKDTKDRFNDGASYGADDCAECLRALKEVK